MKKRITVIAVSALTAVLVSVLALCMFAFGGNGTTLPEKVFVGDVVTIPQRTLSHGTETKEASVLITSPGGGTYTGDRVVAREPGQYRITYRADFDGYTETETVSFLAVRRPKDMFAANAYATAGSGRFEAGETVYDGVLLEMKNGAEVTFDKIIDVSRLGRTDDFLELMVIPSSEDRADFTELVITLTDADDPENKVTVSVRDAGASDVGGRGSFVKIGATGQKPGGFEYFWDWENNIPGKTVFNTFFRFGTPTWMSFRKLRDGNTDGYFPLRLGLDYADRAFYVSRYWGHDYTVMVNDLDSLVNYGSDIWGGFTSGRAVVSFSVSGLTSSSANVLVSRICGYDLSAECFEDTEAPVIAFDADMSRLPRSAVGAKYRLFDAVVTDDYDDDLTLSTSVKYLYHGAEYDVGVSDGYFATDYPGLYRITYRACDRSGNTAERQVEILCDAADPDVTVDVPQSDVRCRLFRSVTVAGTDRMTVSEDGMYTKSVKVLAPDGTEVSLKDNTFTPDKAGKYLLVYTVTDYIGRAYTRQFTVEVQPLDTPEFITGPYLPPAFLYGFSYDLPQASAYEGAGTVIKAVAYIDGAECGGSFTPDAAQAARGFVTVRYAARGESGIAEYTQTVRVVSPIVKEGDASYLDQAAYFLTDNATATMEKDWVSVRFGTNGGFTFANRLNAETVGITFVCADGNSGAIRIRLSDAADSTAAVTLTVTREDGRYLIAFPHDENRYALGQKGESIGISYHSDSHGISGVDNNICGRIRHYDDGRAFAGFGETVYLSVFCDTETESILRITGIVNQTLGHRSSAGVIGSTDLIAPEIVAGEDAGGYYSIGDTAVISAVRAYDVLSPIRSVRVGVTAPDGTVILSGADGTVSHSIRVDAYGLYTVTYTAMDTCGKRTTYYRTIFVRENEAPSLTVKTRSVKKTYRVGDKITLPDYSVSDNSGAYTLDIMLICPDNSVIYLLCDESGRVTSCLNAENPKLPAGFLAGEKAFRLGETGHYTLRFFAYDGFYNRVVTEISFDVK